MIRSEPSSSRLLSYPLSFRRDSQKSIASVEAMPSWMVWIMPGPGMPGSAPGYSNQVRIDPGVPASSPKYRW